MGIDKEEIFFLRIVIYTIYVYVAFLTADNFIAQNYDTSIV